MCLSAGWSENHSTNHYKIWKLYPSGYTHYLIRFWRNFGGNFFVVFKAKHSIGHCFDWCEPKRRCMGWILGQICDLDLWPHPWPWPFYFQGKISKQLYLLYCYLIDVKLKESKSVRYWTDCMTLHFDHIHDIDLVVSRSKYEIAIFKEWGEGGWLTWKEKDVTRPFMTTTVTYG